VALVEGTQVATFPNEAMKRFLSLGLFGLGVVILAGCPIYSDDSRDNRVCDQRSCYDCPNDYYTSDCSPISCGSSYDCPSGYACDSTGTCVGGGVVYPVDSGVDGGSCSRPSDCKTGYNCGSDGTCHIGDCSNSGCPSGLVCKLSDGALQCVGTVAPPDAGKDGSTPDAGPFTGCTSDNDCPSPSGSRCLDGTCVAPADQCTDGTQCTGGSQCVQGACTPSCDASHPCPTGYGCDTGKGVCTLNPKPCNDAPTSCAAGTTCAQDHCAEPCGDGGTCANGLVCIQGGCVPNEIPQFTCATEGKQDVCASGSLCLHHSCYIACDPDAGIGCKSADKFNTCKTVTSTTGSYSVCGSSTNLGTDCDLTQGKACTSPLICIDGFCR
jgi:hypothetical protein